MRKTAKNESQRMNEEVIQRGSIKKSFQGENISQQASEKSRTRIVYNMLIQ